MGHPHQVSTVLKIFERFHRRGYRARDVVDVVDVVGTGLFTRVEEEDDLFEVAVGRSAKIEGIFYPLHGGGDLLGNLYGSRRAAFQFAQEGTGNRCPHFDADLVVGAQINGGVVIVNQGRKGAGRVDVLAHAIAGVDAALIGIGHHGELVEARSYGAVALALEIVDHFRIHHGARAGAGGQLADIVEVVGRVAIGHAGLEKEHDAIEVVVVFLRAEVEGVGAPGIARGDVLAFFDVGATAYGFELEDEFRLDGGPHVDGELTITTQVERLVEIGEQQTESGARFLGVGGHAVAGVDGRRVGVGDDLKGTLPRAVGVEIEGVSRPLEAFEQLRRSERAEAQTGDEEE